MPNDQEEKQKRESLIESFVEIKLKNADSFLIIKETLTRIGVDPIDNTLHQICYILHRKGRYYLVHGKQMSMLDTLEIVPLNSKDLETVYTVSLLLKSWNLASPVNRIEKFNRVPLTIVPHKNKAEWKFVSEYQIGTTPF